MLFVPPDCNFENKNNALLRKQKPVDKQYPHILITLAHVSGAMRPAKRVTYLLFHLFDVKVLIMTYSMKFELHNLLCVYFKKLTLQKASL